MKKLKHFVWGFCWMLACQVIVSDLGIVSDRNSWGKYMVAVGVALMWTFFIEPRRERRLLGDVSSRLSEP